MIDLLVFPGWIVLWLGVSSALLVFAFVVFVVFDAIAARWPS